MNKIIKIVSAVWLCMVCPHFAFAQTAGLMPMAVQQFFDGNGNPLSAGTVTTYIAGTSTLKTTWRDAGETIPNTNPIVLDAGGKAIIFGDGNYRQLVKDRNGNIIWDAVTSAFGTGSASQQGDGTSVGTILPWSGLVAPARYAFAYGQELSRVTYSSLYNIITLTTNVSCTSTSNILSGFSDTTQIPIGAKIEVSCVASGTTVTAKSSSTVTVSNNASTTISATAIIFPWGNGNGTTTFNVPDLRGRVLPGRDNMGGTAAARLTTAIYGAANPDSLGGAGGSQSQTLITGNLPAYIPTGTVTDSGHVHPLGNNMVIGASAIAAGQATVVATGGSLNTASGTANSTFAGVAQGGTSTPFAIVQPSITLNYIVKILPDVSISTLNVVASLGGMVGDVTCSGLVICSGNNISVAGAGSGDVVGPANSIDGNMAVFDGTTGKLLRAVTGTNAVANVQASGMPGFDGNPLFVYNNVIAQTTNPALRVDRISDYVGGPGLANPTVNTILANTTVEPFVADFEWTILGWQHNRALALTGSQNVAIDGTMFKEVSGTRGIYATTGASGNGTTATVTYTGPQIARVGDRVIIDGMTPSGYNHSAGVVVTAASAGSVSFLSAQTGSQTVAGTIKGGTVGPSWGGNFVCQDLTGESDPVTSCIGIELNVLHDAISTDINRQRVGLQFTMGHVPGTDGTPSHTAYGILMGNTQSNGIIDRAFATFNSYLNVIDTSAATVTGGALFMTEAQRIVFDGIAAGTYNRSLRYRGGELVYSTQLGEPFTIQDAGKITQTTGALANPGENIGNATIASVAGQRGGGAGNGGYHVTSIFNDSSNLLTGLAGQVVQAGDYLQWSVGGANAAGIRYATLTTISQTSNINKTPSSFTPGNDTAFQTEIVPFAGISNIGANLTMGGTNAVPWGNAFGMYGVCQVGDNAGSSNRRYRSCIGAELDTEVGTGANFDVVANLFLVSNNKSTGVSLDAYLAMTSVGGGASGKDVGILFTDYVGLAPVRAAGTLIKSVGASTVTNGIDWTSYTFSGAAILTPGFAVNGTGQIAATLPTSAGGGGLFVCIDTAGAMYKKATCP